VKRDSLSLSIAVGLYGSAFGAASITAGFSVLQTSLFSLLLFSGASQFAAVGVIGAGGGVISAVLTSTFLGTRNALYGLTMAQILKVKGFRKVLAAQVTIDESTGVSISQNSEEEKITGFWWTGIGVFVFWNLFTLIGAFGAQAIGNTSAWGLDSAVPAAFLALLWPRLKNRGNISLALVSAGFAVALVPSLPAGVPIISTVVLAIIAGWRE
jgi:predicted branched-subunit amino acid permease